MVFSRNWKIIIGIFLSTIVLCVCNIAVNYGVNEERMALLNVAAGLVMMGLYAALMVTAPFDETLLVERSDD